MKGKLAEFVATDIDGVELSVAIPPGIPECFVATIGITTPPGGYMCKYVDGGVTVVFGLETIENLHSLIRYLQTIVDGVDSVIIYSNEEETV